MLFRSIRISGVGPRTALSILSGLSVAELAQAVTEQDAARLTRIPGIGKKTAERIVLELQDRVAQLGEPVLEPPGTPGAPGHRLRDDLQSALQNLGYHRPLVEKAVDSVLRVMGHRSKLLGLELIAQGGSVTNNTIVVAGNTEEFIRSLKQVDSE